jgi:hypothetical protein
MLFRRREPLHARLAREGGLQMRPENPGPHWGEVGIHGIARPREWDAVVAVEAPALGGDELRFVVLEDGTLVIEEGLEGDDPSPLADGLEGALPPPYRVEARRRSATTWAVGARRIDVLELDEPVDGDELSLTVHEGARELLVDGRPAFGSVRGLERWAADRFDSYALTAERLDGDLWEVRAAPL